MSNERRHLRFLITSALLVGPAIGCGSAENESQTAPIERPPTGNPMGPVDPTGRVVEPVTGEVVEPTGEVDPTGEQAIGQATEQATEQRPVGDRVIERPPTGNPVGPTPQPPVIVAPIEDPTDNPVGPEPEVAPIEPVTPSVREPRPRTNIRPERPHFRAPTPTE